MNIIEYVKINKKELIEGLVMGVSIGFIINKLIELDKQIG